MLTRASCRCGCRLTFTEACTSGNACAAFLACGALASPVFLLLLKAVALFHASGAMNILASRAPASLKMSSGWGPAALQCFHDCFSDELRGASFSSAPAQHNQYGISVSVTVQSSLGLSTCLHIQSTALPLAVHSCNRTTCSA